jgi:hypothetical protein
MRIERSGGLRRARGGCFRRMSATVVPDFTEALADELGVGSPHSGDAPVTA